MGGTGGSPPKYVSRKKIKEVWGEASRASLIYTISKQPVAGYFLYVIIYRLYPRRHPPTHSTHATHATHATHLHQPTQLTIYVIYIYIYIYMGYVCVCAWEQRSALKSLGHRWQIYGLCVCHRYRSCCGRSRSYCNSGSKTPFAWRDRSTNSKVLCILTTHSKYKSPIVTLHRRDRSSNLAE